MAAVLNAKIAGAPPISHKNSDQTLRRLDRQSGPQRRSLRRRVPPAPLLAARRQLGRERSGGERGGGEREDPDDVRSCA